MRVNFSVTNQLATPSIHASALANRPPAGQPGRLFVDTDNPSSGIYRDTGTVWLNITGGAGASNLQTVTDAGNTTDNNILLTYPDNTLSNALVFYNDALAQEEYLIEKRGTGITTNDSLAIQSRGNISPSTNPVGFLIDGANDVVRSFYTTAYTNVGLKLDFANNIYSIGTDPAGYGIGGFWFDLNNFDSLIGDGSLNSNGTVLSVYNSTQTIKTANQGNDIGLKLDFIENAYGLGTLSSPGDGFGKGVVVRNLQSINPEVSIGDMDGDNPGNLTYFAVLDYLQLIRSVNQGVENGLKLDFDNGEYYFGNFLSTANNYIRSDNANGISIGDEFGHVNGTVLFVQDNSSLIKTEYQGSNIGLNIDFSTNLFWFGNLLSGDSAFWSQVGECAMGDFNGNANGSQFGVSDANQTLICTNNLTVGTSGPTSGKHLKIKIGGTDYVIELKDP